MNCTLLTIKLLLFKHWRQFRCKMVLIAQAETFQRVINLPCTGQ